jgi:LacI family transcriptional regulator
VATAKGNQWRRRPEQVRSAGYRQAMHGHRLDEFVNVVATNYSEEGGYIAALELLGGRNRPTAIFAGADVAALGVLRAAAELGIRIPEDLSLVGYDNTNIASLAPIQLTSVDQAGSQIGETAVRLLCERIDGRTKSIRTSTAPSLVVRKTTGPPTH